MKPDQGIYVVMADNGVGEFLWYKDNDAPIPLCGANVYSLMDRSDPDPIMSSALFSDFCEWCEEYLRNTLLIEVPINFNWVAFNEQGMALAKRLKSEWGDEIVVRYVRPPEDPGRKRMEFTEFK